MALLHGAFRITFRTTPANGAGGGRDRTGPRSTRNYLLLLLNYNDMNQRRTRVFESNRPSPVFAVVSPRERPMTALRGAARARHRIDVPSR